MVLGDKGTRGILVINVKEQGISLPMTGTLARTKGTTEFING